MDVHRTEDREAFPWRDPLTAQVLIDLKSADPTALTAAEAIRHLLGFGDRLVSIRRRFLHEIVLLPPDPGPGAPGRSDADSLCAALSEYLDRTVVFWNPNKHRAWIRLFGPGAAEGAWEANARARHPSAFGLPALDEPAWDHVLLWNRGQGNAPADLRASLKPWSVAAYGNGELYSLQWGTESLDERADWTEQVAVARSRGQGLLVNPHYQDHRILQGTVPLPLWGGVPAGAAAAGSGPQGSRQGTRRQGT